jgi:hypothetical protein
MMLVASGSHLIEVAARHHRHPGSLEHQEICRASVLTIDTTGRPLRQETGEQKAERIVREELNRLGWPEDQLPGRPKGRSGKEMMARRLRQETTLSLKWIAQRLQMGTWTYVPNLLNERPASPAAQKVLPLCQ